MSSSPEARSRPFLIDCAILAGLVLFFWSFMPGPSLHQSERAKIQAVRSQIAMFAEALEQYARDNGRLPTSTQGLIALVERPNVKPLPPHWRKRLDDVSSVPKDPWGNDYVYQSPGPHGEPFLITSYGPDGKPGGDDITGGARDDENR